MEYCEMWGLINRVCVRLQWDQASWLRVEKDWDMESSNITVWYVHYGKKYLMLPDLGSVHF